MTEGDGDWTEHGIFGVDSEERAYLLDWWRGQTTPEVWIDTMLDMAHKWKPVLWWGESGVIRRSVEPFLMKRMRERKIFQPVAWLPSISDKPTRARSIQGRYGLGMVYHPSAANAPWIADLERQMLAFPAGRNDDGVDVLGLFGRGIESTFGAEEPGTKALTPEQIRRKALNLPAEEASSGRSKYRD